MAKRNTDTDKWDKKWYMDLDPVSKCAWEYLWTKCDNAGVIELNRPLASYQIMGKVDEIDWDDMLQKFGEMIKIIGVNKIWLKAEFLEFVHGNLTEKSTSNYTKSIFSLIKSHKLPYPSSTLPEGLVKGTYKTSNSNINNKLLKEGEEMKEKGEQKSYDVEKEIICYFNEVTGSHHRIVSNSTLLRTISARLNEGHSVDDGKLVIDFKNFEWADNPEMVGHLKISTLFAPSHFDEYLQVAKKWEETPALFEKIDNEVAAWDL